MKICFLFLLCLGLARTQVIEDLFGPEGSNGDDGPKNLPDPITVEPPQEPDPTPELPSIPVKVPFSLTPKERDSLLDAHNDLRKKKNITPFAWSEQLEVNANMIVDCSTEFPGPAPTYTNFGKSKLGPLSDVVAAWGNESPNLRTNALDIGCRASFYGGTRCNHYTNLMQAHLRHMACASKDCETAGTQLTCVYIDYEDYRPYEDMFGYGRRLGRR